MPVTVECSNCHQPLTRSPSLVNASGNNFCNRHCQSAWVSNQQWSKVEVPCGECGTILYRTPRYIKKSSQQFCNQTCKAAWHSKSLRGSDSPIWKRVECACSYCGATLYRQPSQLSKQANHFCGQACYVAWQSRKMQIPCTYCGTVLLRRPSLVIGQDMHFCDERCRKDHFRGATHPRANRVKTACGYCDQPMVVIPSRIANGRKVFCSDPCRSAAQSEQVRGERSARWVERVTLPCDECGTDIQRRPYELTKRKRHYCSQDCRNIWQSKHVHGENHPSWEGGMVGYRGPNWPRKSREARKRDGYTCQHCGIKQSQVGRKLDVHHIVPFKRFGYIPGVNENYKAANQLSNLITLCQSCHQNAEHGNLTLQARLGIVV